LGRRLLLLLAKLLDLLLQPLLGPAVGLLLRALLGLLRRRIQEALLLCLPALFGRFLGALLRLGLLRLLGLRLGPDLGRGGRALLRDTLGVSLLLLELLHPALLRGLALLRCILGPLLGRLELAALFGLLRSLRRLILRALLRLLLCLLLIGFLQPLRNIREAPLLSLLATLCCFGGPLGFLRPLLSSLLGSFLGAPLLLGILGPRGIQRLLHFGQAPLVVVLGAAGRACART
jgi:hypothetical protein